MSSTRQILIDAIAKNVTKSHDQPLRIDFKLSTENFHHFLQTIDKAWYTKTENKAKNYYAKKSKVLTDYAKKFPNEKQTDYEKQKQRLIYLYIEESIDPSIEDSLPVTREALLLLIEGESSYIDAHKTCRYILEISKDKNGCSSIQPELKYDSKQNRFYVEIPAKSLRLLTQLSHNPPSIKEPSWISKWITSLIAPYKPEIHYAMRMPFYTRFKYLYPFKDDDSPIYASYETKSLKKAELAFSPLRLRTKDGILLDGIEINKRAENSRAYIIHCHGNAQFYWENLSEFSTLATETDCNVISFDYRGYGLSQGQVKSKKDLYEDAFTYAKHCVDKGAEYVLLDGFSLGGAVASKVANKLVKYCKSNSKSVQIELFNSGSFSSTADMVHGTVKEINIPFIEQARGFGFTPKRSEHGIFRTALAGILSFIIKPILKITNWLMEPRKEVEKMPADSYEIISAKGDMVIGTYASMEYKLRNHAQKEVFACQVKIANLKKEIDNIKEAIVALLNEELKRPSQTSPPLEHNSLAPYTAADIKNMNLQNNFLWVANHDHARFDTNIEKLINELEKNELLLKREELNIKMKQNRLMWSRQTAEYKDFEANAITNTHRGLNIVKSGMFADGVEKQIAFVNSRSLRRDANSPDYVTKTREAKSLIDNAVSLITRNEPTDIRLR